MKKFFLPILLMMFCMSMYAADIIVLTNSTKIDAKILEVSDTEIKYKKANNLEGPTFIIKTNQISAIIYENGDVTSYAGNASATNEEVKENKSDAPKAAKKEIKLKFNPQPSDNYAIGLTLGYVSKNQVISSVKGSWLLGLTDKVSPAMRFGMTANPTFKYGIGIRTGAYMEYAHESITDGEMTTAAHDITFSVPLQVSYRYELIPNLSFMIYTGPVFDFGAYMMLENKDNRYPEYNTKSTNLYPDMYEDHRYWGFNVLWGIGAGVQWSHLRLDVGGEFGLMNDKLNIGCLLQGYEFASYLNKPVYVTLTYLF